MGKVAITQQNVLTNQQINSVVPNENKVSTEFLYLQFVTLHNHLRNLAFGGSTMPILNKGEFQQIEILLPDLSSINSFTQKISPMFKTLDANDQQIQTLTKTRDTLLPKLISGELKI